MKQIEIEIPRITKSDIKYFRSLSQKKNRDVEKKFVLEGWRSLEEALKSTFAFDFVAVTDSVLKDSQYEKVLQEIIAKGILLKQIKQLELDQVSKTIHSQGVITLMMQESYDLDALINLDELLLVAIDAVSDPGNLGTIIRTCDWFGVNGIVLGEGCVEPYNEKVVRSTAGSLFHIPVFSNIELVSLFKKLEIRGIESIGLAADGEKNINEVVFTKKCCLVIGSEAHGIMPLHRQHLNSIAGIPVFGKAESLNAGVACGIALSWARMK